MAERKGLTIKQGFERALKDYRQMGDTEMIAFFEKRLEQENKKASTVKRTPRQIENDAYKEIILNGMQDDETYTIEDMMTYFGLPLDMKYQRVSALLSQLIDEAKISKSYDKKKTPHFKKIKES